MREWGSRLWAYDNSLQFNRVMNHDKLTATVSLDIELTNACNAACTFCPRDNMPQIGVISRETFYKAVDRALEHPAIPLFRFCGTGDALMNKNIVEYTRHICNTGHELSIATNGHLMTEEKALALIEAGLTQLTFSISSRGKRYEAEYGLDYETTERNILRFAELAEGKCDVRLAIVMHDSDTPYAEDIAYWRSVGIKKFMRYQLINRAGALYPMEDFSEDEVSYAKREIRARGGIDGCLVPFRFMFIGWDGHYYLCSSDWRKQAPVGHVDTHSIEDTLAARLEAVRSRKPICRHCTSDPANRLLTDRPSYKNAIRLPLVEIS